MAKKEVQKVVRTSDGLRDAMYDEMDAIRDGTGNPTRANAVAKLAGGIVDTVRLELEVHRLVKNSPPRPDGGYSLEGTALQLGRQK